MITSSLSVPLEQSTDGVLRVAGTRVTLDSVASAYFDGYSAEDIVQQYPTLAIADVYSVISYVLQNRAEVDQYLQTREGVRQQVQQENEARTPADGIRQRLLARRQRS